jgi:hypothetical protein
MNNNLTIVKICVFEYNYKTIVHFLVMILIFSLVLFVRLQLKAITKYIKLMAHYSIRKMSLRIACTVVTRKITELSNRINVLEEK